MTPKEKAKELVDKMMYHLKYNCQPTLSEMVAKQCALIAVDNIILANPHSNPFNTDVYSISKSLGHSNLSITENYLNDFERVKVDGDNTELFRMMNLSKTILPKI